MIIKKKRGMSMEKVKKLICKKQKTILNIALCFIMICVLVLNAGQEVKAENLKISVMGDSISTYYGYSNNVVQGIGGVHDTYDSVYYPKNSNLTSVYQTWWMQSIGYMGGQIVSNDSIGGTCVGYYNNNTDDYYRLGSKWCMNNPTRINDLGQPDPSTGLCPDVILFMGGTNDACQADFNIQTFMNNYSNTVRLMSERYNNPTIMCITPYYSILSSNHIDEICYAISVVASQYPNCVFVNLRNLDMTGKLDVNAHPNVDGMTAIASEVVKAWNNR